MGRTDHTITFGPVVGIDANVIHLSQTYKTEKQDEGEVIVQLAGHAKAMADLMSQLSAEIAALDRKGDLSPLVSATALMGERLSTVGSSLDNWGGGANSRRQPVSSEKNAL